MSVRFPLSQNRFPVTWLRVLGAGFPPRLSSGDRSNQRTNRCSHSTAFGRGAAIRAVSQKKSVQLKVTVTSERPDEYIGKKGLVKNQVITCQDVDPSGYRLLMPFDYTLSEDEKAKYAGKLQDKTIVVGVRELMPFGGRLRARGAIVNGPEGK